MVSFFELFLPSLAFLLSVVSLVVFYWVVTRCEESAFMPMFYFIGLSIFSLGVMSISRISRTLFGSELFQYTLVQDLMVSYLALFLFGALWQSYETSICVPPPLVDRE